MNSTLLEAPAASHSSPSLQDYALTREEINRFHAEGYLGPFAAVSPEEMAEIQVGRDTVQVCAP